MRAYGNMSHAEKQINKKDLRAYKEYDGNNYAMIPGVQNVNIHNLNRNSVESPDNNWSPKPKQDLETKNKINNEKF